MCGLRQVGAPLFWKCVASKGGLQGIHSAHRNAAADQLGESGMGTRFWLGGEGQSTKDGEGGASRDQNGAFAVERIEETAAHGQ